MDIVSEIREWWGWVGIDPDEVVAENDFGNLIIRDHSGNYWRLCPEDSYCRIIARSREELDELTRDQEFLNDWCMSALVEEARRSLGPLTDGRKYYLVIPGILGGVYNASNIKTLPLDELIRVSGDIAQQIKDVPDGAKVKIEVTD